MDKVKAFFAAVFAYVQASTVAQYALITLAVVAVLALVIHLAGPVISGVVGGLVVLAAVYLVRKYGVDTIKSTVLDFVAKVKGFFTA